MVIPKLVNIGATADHKKTNPKYRRGNGATAARARSTGSRQSCIYASKSVVQSGDERWVSDQDTQLHCKAYIDCVLFGIGDWLAYCSVLAILTSKVLYCAKRQKL